MKKVVICLGTGRCGTLSMSKLLKKKGGDVSHEQYRHPWKTDIDVLYNSTVNLLTRDGDFVGDSGYYWLNYAQEMIRVFPNLRFVCLKRDKKEVIESFNRRTPNANWWTSPKSKHWDWVEYILDTRMYLFPKYDLPKKEAIGEYWEDYYRIANSLERLYGGLFKIFDFKYVLNTEEGQKELFNFLDLDGTTYLGIKQNTEKKRVKVVEEFYGAVEGIGCGRCNGEAKWTIKCKPIVCHSCDECKEETITFLKGGE